MRNYYFHNIGTPVINSNINSIEEAVKFAKINYTVEPKEIFLAGEKRIEDNFANVRSDNGAVLGIVGKKYKIVQNQEAFSIIDPLIKEQRLSLTKIGSYDEGRKAFVIARSEPFTVLGENYENYFNFHNSFDGSGTVKVFFGILRQVCTNGLMIADKKAKFAINIQHCKKAEIQLYEAHKIINSNELYKVYITNLMEKLAETRFNKEQFAKLIDQLVEVNDNDSNIMIERAEEKRNELLKAYNQEDLNNFENSAFKALMAISDYESHFEPLRNTGNEMIYFQRIIAGMSLLNIALNFIKAETGFKL